MMPPNPGSRPPGPPPAATSGVSIVDPDRIDRFTWHQGDLDFAPRNALMRLVWSRTWGLRSAWQRLVARLRVSTRKAP